MSAPVSASFDIPYGFLAALCAPGDAPGEGLRAAFGQGGAADTLRPGPVLAAATEQAAVGLPDLSDDELTGVIHAARRLENRAFYLQTAAVAEFTRRRAQQLEYAKARKVPRGCREGEYPDLELAAELLISRRRAQALMDETTELATRLPRTFAGMAEGRIDPARGLAIADATLCLSDLDAAYADEVLVTDAHEVRADTVARRAAALAMKLDPEAVRREREDARNTRQRVEARREFSGNACLSGREMDVAEVMAAKANIDAISARLRNAGLDGTADAIRARAYLDLLQSRNPFDRLAPAPAGPDDDWPDEPAGGSDDHEGGETGGPGDSGSRVDGVNGGGAGDPACSGQRNSDEDEHGARYPPLCEDEVDEGGIRYPCGPGTPVGGLAPLPALVNLIVPAATLLGWGTAPGQAASWGLTDPEETRDIVQAASTHPRTRWCVTVVNEAGEAVAHACARGRRPWTRDPRQPLGRGQPPGPPQDPGQRPARVQDLLSGLGITPADLEPIARGTCNHRHAEDRYTPSRKLKHLIRARTATCDAPACNAQAIYSDIDHTIPWPEGPTEQCNLGPKCRAHHRAKQAPGWHVEQPEPGVIRWSLPNGRTHVTRPARYGH